MVALGHAWVALCATVIISMCIAAWRSRESNNPIEWLGIIDKKEKDQ